MDAEAICEAMSRPNMRFVAPKTVAQQDIQATHRIREELVGQRTAKANQIRGLMGEYGIIAPVGIQQLRRALPRWLEDAENGLTDSFRILLNGLAEDLRYLDDRITTLDGRITESVKQDPVAKRLMTLRGVGPLTAIEVPWTRPGSDFTLLFEKAAISLVKEMPVLAVSRQLEITNKRLWRIVHHYVGCMLNQLDLSRVATVGVDEMRLKCGVVDSVDSTT